MDLDLGWAVVADALVVGSFDEVGVVACAFDDAGVGSVSSAFSAAFVDFVECLDESSLPLLRGKNPPAL